MTQQTMNDDVQVQHQNLCPVILIGHGSSGTSIFSRLLREHLRISFGTESQFITRYARRLDQYGDLNQDANLKKLIDDICRERWFERCHGKFGYTPDKAAILASVQQRTYRGLLDAIFLQLAAYNHMAPRWGDKTPGYAFETHILAELFPDAKYIQLTRDGRDVALSVMGRFWGAQNIYTAAKYWTEAVDRLDQFAGSLPAEQLLSITYEQLLSDPVATFERVIDYLEIEPGDELLRHLEPQLHAQLNKANFDKWRTKMTPAQRQLYENIACKQLQRHGYETEIASSDYQPSTIAKLYWWCENKARKYTYLDYWKDNLYHARRSLNERLRALRG